MNFFDVSNVCATGIKSNMIAYGFPKTTVTNKEKFSLNYESIDIDQHLRPW